MNGHHSTLRPNERDVLPEAETLRLSTPFDARSLLLAVGARWRWVAAISLLFLLVGLLAAVWYLPPGYSVSMQLSRHEPPTASEAFKPLRLTTPAIFGMIASPEALQNTGSRLTPPLSAEALRSRLFLTLDRTSELITVTTTGASAEEAVALANLFSRESVAATQAMQHAEASEADRLVARQLANIESDRANVTRGLTAIETQRASARLEAQALRLNVRASSLARVDSARITRLEERTQTAREDLTDLQARFTDAHPLVREQRSRVTSLETQLADMVSAGATNDGATDAPVVTASLPAEAAPVSADQSTGYDALALRLSAIESNHAELIARQRAIQLVVANPPGYLRVLHAAALENVLVSRHRLSIGVLALLSGALGALLAIVVIALRELLDDRLKTGADVMRVTHLPLLGALGDLDAMTPANKSGWAFRTWTALQHHLSASPNHGMICGFTSSRQGEGRSTWIELLSDAARRCGFTVLTISAPEAAMARAGASPAAAKSDETHTALVDANTFTNLVLADPTQLLERLTAPNRPPLTNLVLPQGWIWNLERRKQWQRALNSWRTIDNVAILIELPPMSDPETVLLAENMPNLVWLTESHKADAVETIAHLETLRHARCRLAGAVLNREPAASTRRRGARWFGLRTTVLATTLGVASATAAAQAPRAADTTDPVAARSPTDFTILNPAQRAPWQQRLTLGPGDVLDLSVYGQPELGQTGVPVGPDGRISFLEAQNVQAAGQTIDEFRAALNGELARSRNAPEVIVIPVAYRSRKYYVLGAVAQRGTFPLNRPMTIIEAVSAAGGLEMEVTDRNLVIVADLQGSFLARQGRHLPVDFARLFREGDLTHNVALEPEDYLYFASGSRQQIYVLGEVRFPGPLVFSDHTGTLAAIAVRGGFSERAWRTRLLVIRGSLDQPETFVVNAADVLAAKATDLQLQPRDIVYVSSRPWIKAEELLDQAVTAFVQAAVITKVGLQTYPTVNP